MDTDRDSTAVVGYGDAVVGVHDHVDQVTKTGHGLVDAVVNDLVDQVVKTGNIDVADIHGRPLPDRFKAFQHLDVVCCVTGMAVGVHIRIHLNAFQIRMGMMTLKYDLSN